MCTILVAYQQSAQMPLLVLANRDEFYSRPTTPASAWEECRGMIAGRDQVSGGTWFGVRDNRWAAVTNVREGIKDLNNHNRSRGWLVRDYLQKDLSPEEYLQQLNETRTDFAGYNLLIGEKEELWYTSNRTEPARCLEPGIYGLSNHLLDTPWPKVVRGKEGLRNLLKSHILENNAAFALLADPTRAADEDLPDTGIPLEWEQALSAIFIKMPQYGTRCSTLYKRSADGKHQLVERRFDHERTGWEESTFSW